jgi:hypothetical protein
MARFYRHSTAPPRSYKESTTWAKFKALKQGSDRNNLTSYTRNQAQEKKVWNNYKNHMIPHLEKLRVAQPSNFLKYKTQLELEVCAVLKISML